MKLPQLGFLIFFVLTTILAGMAHGRSSPRMELAVWETAPRGPRIIVPRRPEETPAEALRRYLGAIDQDSDLRRLGRMYPNAHQQGRTVEWTPPSDSRPRLAFLANELVDMVPLGERIMTNIETFSRAGADTFVIALAAEHGLTADEARDFRERVAERFHILVALGGEDVAEEYSSRRRTPGSGTNLTRDRAELGLIDTFKARERGLFFGICRGHQIGGIADGHALYEDLSRSGIGRTGDHVNERGRTVQEMQRWHHIYLEESSLLSRLLRRANESNPTLIRVNSIHHQAVALRSSGVSTPNAWHETSGVEGLETPNRRSVSVQFHPELPAEVLGDNEFAKRGQTLIRNVVAYGRLLRQQRLNSCRAVFH